MAKFRLSHFLIRDHCLLETDLSVREVLTRVYTKIGKPRPYALERALRSRSPHVFDGAVSRTVSTGYELVPARYKDVPIQGTVTTVDGKTRIALRLGGDSWATFSLIAGAAIVAFLSYALIRNASEGKEVDSQILAFLILGVLGYIIGFGIFRYKAAWARQRLAELFEARELR